MKDAATPKGARDAYERQNANGAGGIPRGFIMRDGTVYVVAAGMRNARDVQETVFHEALGHYGLRGLYGKDLTSVLKQVATLRRADVEAKMKSYGFTDTPVNRLRAAEEVLAEMAQTRPELGFVKRAVSAIRAFLRKLGLPVPVSDNDLIAGYVLPARRYVESGKTEAAQGQSKTAGLAATPQPAFAISPKGSFTTTGSNPAKDFVLRDGQKDLARIPEEAEKKTRGEVRALPIRLSVGKHFGKNRGFGLAHIEAEHGAQIRAKGLSVEQFVAGVLDGAAKIYAGDGNRLTIHNDRSPYGNAYVELRDDGGFYSVVTAFSEQRPRGVLVWSGRNGILSTQGSEPSAAGKRAAATTGQSVSPSAQNVNGVIKPNPTTEALAGHTSSNSVRPESETGKDEGADFSLASDKANAVFDGIRDRIGVMNDTAKTFNGWWHKTVGTQYHKAQVDKDFGRVFNRSQQYLTDVSRYALSAADLAQDILPRFDKISDVTKSGATRRELNPVADAVFQGTLNYTRDAGTGELKQTTDAKEGGVVFTPAELKQHFGLNDRQIELYQQTRAAINRGLEDLAITEMVKLAGNDVPQSVAQAAAAAGSMVDARKLLVQALGSKADTPITDADGKNVGTIAEQIDDRIKKIEELKDAGYAPLMRFGEYTLHVTGDKGESLYYGMFENEADRRRMEKELREVYPKASFTSGVLNDEAFKQFQGLSLDSLNLFARITGSLCEVFEREPARRLARGSGAQYPFSLHPHGLAGANGLQRRGNQRRP